MAPARYPRLGEVFKLTLESDRPDCQPQVMPQSWGYSDKDWRFTGEAETGVLVRELKLVGVETSYGWVSLGNKLEEQGKSPSGQWIMAFLAAFPDSDGRGKVGIYDNSWTHPKFGPCYPCIFSSGKRYFPPAAGKFSQFHRWIVYA